MKAGFFIAFRYLLGRAGEGGRYLQGAATGIALSLIPIIVTLIVADGMIRGITDRHLELGTGHLQTFNLASPGDLQNIAPALMEEEAVRGVWAERRGLGIIIGGRGKTGATVRAVDPSFWEDKGSGKYLTTIAGEARIQSDREVLLGEALADSIGAEVGKNIRLMTMGSAEDGRNIPKTTVFKVRGIISSGYREIDALWCIMSYEAGKAILPPKTSSSYLILKIADPYRNADATARYLNYILGPRYAVYTWQELQPSLYDSYESTRQLLLLIMALIVLVAAVNVSSATSMLALERRRDIAVLKTAGASPGATSRIFLWGSCLTGLTGAIVGIGVGLLIGKSINPLIHGLEAVLGFFSRLFNGGEVKILDPGFYLETIPIVIDWTTVFFIGFFTVLCSVIASWIPARQAGKVKPIEILRKY
ncbi:MAG: ABC transporter permease [Spirochaetaceae bacterium]|jgi:lipoprotein-releasing system permease protein|nr:ABC transporter permease [Spirochaetaceae bacterium]